MFNGLIRDFGTVQEYADNELIITSDLCERINAALGDSIAINGACLSVTRKFAGAFAVAISSETAAVIAPFKKGARVHLEPAMALGDRIDGHLLQGHIDSLGVVSAWGELACGKDLFIKVLNLNAAKYIANKGSVGINGVSLTVNEISGDLMRLTLIPITLEKTLLGSLKVGDLLNIETDLLARYAEKILRYERASQGINHAALY